MTRIYLNTKLAITIALLAMVSAVRAFPADQPSESPVELVRRTVQREIALQGKEPTNLAFGGKDGRTVFVTQRQGGYIEAFRTDKEGREHCVQNGSC